MQKQTSILTGIIIIVAVAVIALSGVFAYQYFSNLNSKILISNQVQSPNAQNQSDTNIANWKTYRNNEYGFEIKLPLDWTVTPSYVEWTKNAKQNFAICPVGEKYCTSGSYIVILGNKSESFNENLAYRGSDGKNYYYSFINDFPGTTDYESTMYYKIFSTLKFTK